MKKNIYLILAASLICCIYSLGSATQSGAFISAGTGMQWLEANTHASAITDVFNHNDYLGYYQYGADSHMSSRNLFGQIGFGYGHMIHCHWYAAAEFTASLYQNRHIGGSVTQKQDSTLPTATDTYSDQLSMHDQMAISALFGYVWPRWMMFTRLGYINAGLDYASSFDIDNRAVSIHDMHSAWSHRVNGALMGLGIRLPVSKHIDLSMEYDYSIYANARPKMISNIVPFHGTDEGRSRADVNINHLQSSNMVIALIVTF